MELFELQFLDSKASFATVTTFAFFHLLVFCINGVLKEQMRSDVGLGRSPEGAVVIESANAVVASQFDWLLDFGY